MYVMCRYDSQLLELVDHRRYYRPYYSREDCRHEEHGDDDGQGTDAHPQVFLYQLDNREQEVCEEPRYKERQERSAEVVYSEEYCEQYDGDDDPADEAVKCNFVSEQEKEVTLRVKSKSLKV